MPRPAPSLAEDTQQVVKAAGEISAGSNELAQARIRSIADSLQALRGSGRAGVILPGRHRRPILRPAAMAAIPFMSRALGGVY